MSQYGCGAVELSGNRFRIACAIRNVSEISAEIDVFSGTSLLVVPSANLLPRTDFFPCITDVACAIKTLAFICFDTTGSIEIRIIHAVAPSVAHHGKPECIWACSSALATVADTTPNELPTAVDAAYPRRRELRELYSESVFLPCVVK